jgi:hypothetical protein
MHSTLARSYVCSGSPGSDIPRLALLVLVLLTTMGLCAMPASATTSTSPPAGNPSSSSPRSGPTGSAGAAATPGRATFGVGPATLGKTDPRGYFSYQMGVGGIYNDEAAVLNYGTAPLVLSVFAADLGNNDTGGIAVGLENQATKDAGGWISLPSKVVVIRVPAKTKTAPGRIIVPFRITVPTNAPPGDHGAAIVATLSTLGKNSNSENVRLDQRVVSRVYVRVNGPLHPKLEIEGLKVSFHQSVNPIKGGSATVSYTVHNTGNVRLAARQGVSITGLFGLKSKVVAPANLQLLFPGASQRVTVRLFGVFPALLEKSHVTVTPQLFQDQRPIPMSNAVASAGFLAIPWTPLGCVGALVLFTGLGWYLRRRARREPPPRHRPDRGPGRPGGPDHDPQLRPQTPETIAS